MIVVTGANGQIGRQIVEGLSKRLPVGQIGVSVRDPEKASDLEQRGLRVCRGDFADASSLAQAFDRAEQVLIVSVNQLGEIAIQQHGNAIRAAREAGAKRILYTSHQGANPSSAVPFARDHAATEELLRHSGVPFVSLRNGFYAESALYQLGGIRDTGRLALPEDGPVSWTARADLAEAAVAALTDGALFDGITPPLTAAEALDFGRVAGIVSELLQREVARVVVSEDAYRTALLSHGLAAPVVDMLAALFQATRAGEFDVVDPTLERILGRKPRAMRETLAQFFATAEKPA